MRTISAAERQTIKVMRNFFNPKNMILFAIGFMIISIVTGEIGKQKAKTDAEDLAVDLALTENHLVYTVDGSIFIKKAAADEQDTQVDYEFFKAANHWQTVSTVSGGLAVAANTYAYFII